MVHTDTILRLEHDCIQIRYGLLENWRRNNLTALKYIVKNNGKSNMAVRLTYVLQPVSYTHLDVYKRQV